MPPQDLDFRLKIFMGDSFLNRHLDLLGVDLRDVATGVRQGCEGTDEGVFVGHGFDPVKFMISLNLYLGSHACCSMVMPPHTATFQPSDFNRAIEAFKNLSDCLLKFFFFVFFKIYLL